MKKVNFYLKLNEFKSNNKSLIDVKHNNEITLQNSNDTLKEKFDFIFTKNSVHTSVNSAIVPMASKNNLRLIKKNNKIVSNLFLIYGPKKSGKSSLLRGENLLDSDEKEGLMIEMVKEIYKLSLQLAANNDDFIILKFAMTANQDSKYYNLIEYPIKNKSFYDELILNNSDDSISNTIYIKHFSSIKEVLSSIEKCLIRREEIIDLNMDFSILYHFIIEVKNKNLDTVNMLQMDFVEFNFDKTEDLFTSIESLISKKEIPEKNKLIQRLLYRNKEVYDLLNLFLCIDNSNFSKLNIVIRYLSTNQSIKSLTDRQDLKYNSIKTIKLCKNCKKINSEINFASNFQSEMFDEIDKMNNDLDIIQNSVRSIKEDDKSLTVKPSNIENKKLEALYKNISMDSIKLEKMITQVNSIFERTKTNISTLKSNCESCPINSNNKFVKKSSFNSSKISKLSKLSK